MTTKVGLWIAIAFAVCAGLFFTYKSLTIEPKIVEVNRIMNPITGETTKVETTKDKYGDTHTTFKLDESNIITVKDLKDPNRPKIFADTVAEVVAKANRIIAIQRFTIQLKDDSLKAERAKNSTRVSYQDKYATIGYTPSLDTSTSGYFDLAYNNVLTVTNYNKRDKVLGLAIGKKVSYTDIATEDSRATINGYKALQIKKPVPFFGLRGQAVSRYNFTDKDLSLGAGIRLDLGKLSVLGSYTYRLSDTQIKPNVELNYDLFRF